MWEHRTQHGVMSAAARSLSYLRRCAWDVRASLVPQHAHDVVSTRDGHAELRPRLSLASNPVPREPAACVLH